MESSSPQRTCIACRRKDAQNAFWRIGYGVEGALQVVENGPANSRSAYICQTRACLEWALGKGKIEHALRRKITPSEKQLISNTLQCKLKKTA